MSEDGSAGGGVSKGFVVRAVARFDAGVGETREDRVAAEEPLEIRVGGDVVAITMRTPGRDHDLALGFLLGERIIASLADVGTISHCGRPGDEGYGNAIDVAPGPGARVDPDKRALRRGSVTTSSCGVCGRDTIEDLLRDVVPRAPTPMSTAMFLRAARALEETQRLFKATGGVHGAVALAAAEDVGRHNAVDKVLGALLRENKRAALLMVSGRVSFEIVQKAAVSAVGAVAGVSAPTGLAVDLAERAGVVLAGFVRGNHVNVYAHAAAVTGTDAVTGS